LENLDAMKSSEAMAAAQESDPTQELSWRRARRWTIACCAALLVMFASIAWSAVCGKSPTFDEPYHALGACLRMWHGEYRFICDDPPLWGEIAALIVGPGSIGIDPGQLSHIDLPMDMARETLWMAGTLFQTPGNDGVAFINRFRVVMLGVALAMAALLGVFVWRLARSSGANPSAAAAGTILATALLALDPNFIAHSPLMKNDVASALMMLGLISSTWAAGRMLTLRRILTLSIWSAVALMVKLNAPLMIAGAAILLVGRAILPSPWRIEVWPVSHRNAATRISRLRAAMATIVVMGLMTIAIIWPSYGFRFAPNSTGGSGLDMQSAIDACIMRQYEARHPNDVYPRDFSQDELANMPHPPVTLFAAWANRLQLLPQAFLAGLLFAFESVQVRDSFLCGKFSLVGSWWYFPFAIMVKTPVATLVAFGAAVSFGLVCFVRRNRRSSASTNPKLSEGIWAASCLTLPVAIYLAAAMSSHVNLGLRHVFPIYLPLFALTGLAMSKLWNSRPAVALLAGVLVIFGLAGESLPSYPNFIPFFNVFASGSHGGLRLLSDSNLDWGQDLPLLAAWQRSHSDVKLYLAYFGTADPAFYGIRYINQEDGYGPGPQVEPLTTPGVIAASATALQGSYGVRQNDKPHWESLWSQKPFTVLGGSIYLFHYPATEADRLPAGQSLID
jgi:hypothetical protein